MADLDSLEKVLENRPDIYVSRVKLGDCKICGAHTDLRDGACFTCADRVCSMKIEGGYKLWSIDNPQNFWFVENSL